MSRAEQRRAMRIKNPTYTLTQKQIDQIKAEAVVEVSDRAFILMLAIPVMVLHDKYGQLMRKDGREEKFAELCLDLYDSFEKGYITLDDLKNTLQEETGMILEKDRSNRTRNTMQQKR